MKRIIFLMCALFALCVPIVFGQDGGDVNTALGLTSFSGIVAVVAFAITEGAKIFPFINKSTFSKIGISLAVAIAVTFAAWQFHVADFLDGMVWWKVAIQGAFAGLSACGFYDVLKAMGLVGGQK